MILSSLFHYELWLFWSNNQKNEKIAPFSEPAASEVVEIMAPKILESLIFPL